MTLELIVGLILIVHGLYSIYACIKNKPLASFVFRSDFFIEKKLLGTSFNRVMNFFFGVTEIALGVILFTII